MEYKSFDFELKKLEEDGTFEGYAATFNKVDLGGDKILPGAFKRTLKANDAFPLHWYHDVRTPVGECGGEEDSKGLKITGKLLIDDINAASELYAFMKKTKTVARQLSIGYDTVKKEYDDEIRILKEIKLYEVSIVTFGMDQEAFITDVKKEDIPESKPSKENHICRINNGDYSRFRSSKRTHNGKPYTIRYGIKKSDGKAEEYEYFYPVEHWTVSEAKSHCKDHDGKFEAAKKSIESVVEQIIALDCNCLSPEQSKLVTKAIESLETLLITSDPLKDTQSDKNSSIFSPLISGLRAESNPPSKHLLKPIKDTLKSKKEN